MNPVEFLDIAQSLQDSVSEAERRTSVGRSYYALYNVLLEGLTSQGLHFGRSAENHRLLVYYFTQCRDRQASRIGAALRDLRSQRNIADYEMSSMIDTAQSQQAYQQAQKAVDRFNALAQTDLPSLIPRIRALPNPPWRQRRL
jgi:hypothetical protein